MPAITRALFQSDYDITELYHADLDEADTLDAYIEAVWNDSPDDHLAEAEALYRRLTESGK